MNLDMIQIPTFLAVLFAIASLVIIPISAMAMSKIPVAVSDENSESADSAACNLAPILEIDDKGTTSAPGDLPAIDKGTTDDFKTATFAMG